MSQTHRELQLLEALRRLGGSARNADLAKALDVSEETVRRTVKALSKTSMVARVRGGAYLVGTQNAPSAFRRITDRPEEKRRIARAASTLIRDGMTLFLEVGTTTGFLAEELRARRNLTVATNAIGVAQTLANVNGNRVHLLGGEMLTEEGGTCGPVTQRQARRMVYDLAVLGTDAVSAKAGFLYRSDAEAALAQVVAEASDQVLVGFDHTKCAGTAPHVGPDPRRVSRVVTDQAPAKPLAKALAGWGIDTLVADPAPQTDPAPQEV